MITTTQDITAALNEAEAAVRPTAADSTPVAITNGTLIALLYAAKRVPELEEDMKTLNAIRALL
jgi:hypothetical protein